MRVLVASDAIGEIDARTAGGIVGGAFRDEGAQVAVVVLAPDAPAPVSVEELVAVLRDGATFVDLRSLESPDLDGVSLLLGHDLSGVSFAVEAHEVEVPLTGLTGSAVMRSRDAGEELAAGLEADARAKRWLASLGLEDRPGAGAAGGVGAVVLAAGGTLVDALEHVVEGSGMRSTARQADLIVTGCTDLDFHAKGGAVVAQVVGIAEEALRPVIVVARRNFVSERELRLAGIEAAYALQEGQRTAPVDEASLRDLAAKIARTWRF